MIDDVEQKRAYLSGLYGGTRKWRRQVARMPDAQVISIYLKEQRRAQPEHAVKPETPQKLIDISVELPKHSHPHENEDEFPIV